MNIFDQFDHNMYGHDSYNNDDGAYIHDGTGHYDAHLLPLDGGAAFYHDASRVQPLVMVMLIAFCAR